MAMGTGCTVPWVTSTLSAACAGTATTSNARMKVPKRKFIPNLLLSHHPAGVEVEGIDFSPLAVARDWKLVGLAFVNCAPGRIGGGAGIRIARRFGLGACSQLWRLCDASFRREEEIEIHHKFISAGCADRRVP